MSNVLANNENQSKEKQELKVTAIIVYLFYFLAPIHRQRGVKYFSYALMKLLISLLLLDVCQMVALDEKRTQ